MNKSVCLGLSIIDLSKTVMYEFWYDYLKPKYGEMQEFARSMQRTSFSIQKQMMFIKILQKMFKQDLALQIMKKTDPFLREKILKNQINKR